jgi:glutamine amidotransferase
VCRLLAYLGPPVTLQSLLVDPPHSLLHQSWGPKHQGDGTVNADGFGVGWYEPDVRPEPALHRTARPMWADRSFASWSGLVRSGAVLAAVRSATPPSPIEESGTPPFTSEQWLFAHNGAVDGFREVAGGRLRHLASDRRMAGVRSASDSDLLFALALDRLDAGADGAEALLSVASTVLELTTARLNLVLTDGRTVFATVWGHSLFFLDGAGPDGDGVVVASEPYDDHPDWRRLPDSSLVVATPLDIVTTALGLTA